MNPFKYFSKIYLINLDKRKDRLDASMEEFTKVGISSLVKRQPGVVYTAFEDPKRNAYVGNHLAHAACLRNARESRVDSALIFEDDVEWFKNPQETKEFLEQSIIELPEDWDMLYLGINMDRYDLSIVSDHIARIFGGFSTHAYAVRSTMFDELIALNEDSNVIEIDVAYTENIIPYHNVYVTIPLLAGQRMGYSDIMGTVMNSNPMFLQRFESRLRR